jgi:hypothetical protein
MSNDLGASNRPQTGGHDTNIHYDLNRLAPEFDI